MQRCEEENLKNSAAMWYIIAALLFIYIVFLILKINGVGDYTSKYGIERISDGEGYNSMMMIDGDVETTWGCLETFEPGSNVHIKFKASRSVSELRIRNVSEYATVPMGIFMSEDGEKFERCSYTQSVDGDITVYKFEIPHSGMYLAFTYGAEAAGHWPITEVEIYE
jgi:hypothetical protein